MFELIDNQPQNAVLKVIGVGGGGGNAVKHMIESSIDGVEFICANTDYQALNGIDAKALQLGGNITKGLGAGANPEVGRQAALEDRGRIEELLHGASMVFITAGMGGGTGTGAAPVVAEIARELGILTVAVVTKPFGFEGKKRMRLAEEGIRELSHHVDSLITIPNEKLEEVLGAQVTLMEAFKAANDVLHGAVQGIADLITRPGVINVDFADVRTVMSENGMAMMGSGVASGSNRAVEAARLAISSPLLDNINLEGARGILVNITSGDNITLGEFTEVGDIIEEMASDNATVVVGTAIDPSMGDEIKVTVVATGLGSLQQDMPVVTAREIEPPVVKPSYSLRGGNAINPDAKIDYSGYSVPPAIRNPQIAPRSVRSVASAAPAVEVQADPEYLDIPAFLRRQAD
jgi:cell division protein FtsZ